MTPEGQILDEFIVMTGTTEGRVAQRLGLHLSTVRNWRRGTARTKFWRLNLIARRLADSDPVMAMLCREMAEAIQEDSDA